MAKAKKGKTSDKAKAKKPAPAKSKAAQKSKAVVKHAAAPKGKPAAAAKSKAVKRAAAPKRPASPAVVHWEVQARDLAGQQQFFANLFGWEIDNNNPMKYGMVAGSGKDSIGGGIGPALDAASRLTVYVQVPNINTLLDKAQSLGAQTVLPRTAYGPVIMALFRDPEGNVIGLIED